jgi:type III restriction enzyme
LELKEYQRKSLDQVKRYLEILADFKAKNEKAKAVDPDISFDFPYKAWEKVTYKSYFSKKNGLKEYLPDFYLKIPTGGGKTLLACHAIDLINKIYLNKQTGLILWIVPTSQIYRQTLLSLKNRENPYRQVLDISSGGRTVILEKGDKFTELDVKQNLLVMMLMLPSANRQVKEVLKVFKDTGGFSGFFPMEDDRAGNEKLLAQYPNLDYFGGDLSAFGKIIKTSLGNTLRLLQPIIIIDEGHKSYSVKARETIAGFNPSIVLELSATPPKGGNILVDISGQELNREEMIKLDLHIINKASKEWKDTMLAAIDRVKLLKEKAKDYESNTGEYIRPICLIQVERTGKDQRGSKFIHAEDVREYLINQCGIPDFQIAIKSSEKDDIEGIDLLSKDCQIRYIITKQALQEGWDCPFAYVLAILTNPSSEVGITQLIGRILRQPKARKTKIKELDESYVFSFRQKAADLVKSIKEGFEQEGLGDIYGRISFDEGDPDSVDSTKDKLIGYRDNFKKYEGKIYLPKFVIQEKDNWRNINYEMDILSRINWSLVNLESLNNIVLSELKAKDTDVTVGLSKNKKEVVETKVIVESEGGLEISRVFITRQILDIVPNPWIAFEIGKKAIELFSKKYDQLTIKNNFVFIIEELRQVLDRERDNLAEKVFRDLVEKKLLCFFLVSDKGGYLLPNNIKVKRNTKALLRDNNDQIQRSLMELVPEDQFNELEKPVAIYLDNQEKLLWWYRNISRQNYFVQGWKKHRIYPDFIFSEVDQNNNNEYDKLFVVETKGLHLKNDDTKYKQNVFDYCNKLGKITTWGALEIELSQTPIEFQVVFEDDWQSQINRIFKS